ncbi:hypothetical protein [Saccharopolyspora spinosa]|uniref:Uncharacterized protein n=1 Tax=Saccharopolyspora spinosa TaxID=60894 RepID=A0A2N3XUH6_SACSN|nr:hypothetical protein [Saccharopolyspora spinosa]PKW14250.1 hypothetical protein A8926_1852 [Saccharopolyspora spinosa]
MRFLRFLALAVWFGLHSTKTPNGPGGTPRGKKNQPTKVGNVDAGKGAKSAIRATKEYAGKGRAEQGDQSTNPTDPSDPTKTDPKAQQKQALIEEAQAQGIKISADRVVEIGKDPNGKIVFLEEGKGGQRGAGLEHIYEEHGSQFEQAGIPKEDVPDLVHKAATEGEYTGYTQGKAPGRPIYEVEHNGQKQYVAVSVGSNGFIVGANMRSGDDPFKGAQKDPKSETNPNHRGY